MGYFMELWDVYEIDRSKSNRTMLRGQAFAENDYHLVVHVCIFNAEGKMLIQQRSANKESWSSMWDISVGGSAVKGDTSQSAAEREVAEEIGLCLDLKNVRPHLTINFEFGFDDIYLIEKDISIADLSLQYEEVQNIRWASKEEICSLIKAGQFIPYYLSLIDLLFDMRKQYGSKQKN